MKRNNASWGKVLAALLLPIAGAWADSITPDSVSATLGLGGSVTINKTVTVSQGTPTSSKVDVFFLADTTGSMGGTINSVKASASSILSSTAGLGDVAWAVGDYQDYPTYPWGASTDHPYLLRQAMTTSQSAAQTGINSWTIGDGWDTPESQLAGLTALSQVAGGTTGWRDGSERIVVWFGDAPGHDPDNTSGYPGPTQAQTIAALQAAGCQVLALNVGYGQLDAYGQATAITGATGGTLYNGVHDSDVVQKIKDAITTAVETYTKVELDLSGVPAGLTATVVPPEFTGTYDRSVDRSFDFEVTLTGDTPGTYDFEIPAKVDGGIVATEVDHVRVVSTPDSGSTLLLLGSALAGLTVLRRRR